VVLVEALVLVDAGRRHGTATGRIGDPVREAHFAL